MRARGLSWFETRGDALLTIRDHNHGLIVMLVAGPGVRRGSASRANSHNSDLVLRGSMISSTQNRSAERNGERSLLRRCPISFPVAFGSRAAPGHGGKHRFMPAPAGARPP